VQWLAICAKNGWEPNAKRLLEILKKKREDSPQRDAEGIKIEGDEEFWKYYVEQELSPETVAAAPVRLEDVIVSGAME
jgi:hypothetical protein